MNANRLRLINAARKALFQRAQVERSVLAVRNNFAPQALKQRATRQVIRSVDDTASAAQAALRSYRVPLAVVALAGLAFAFRRPLATAAQVVADQATDAVDAVAEQLRDYRSKQSSSRDQEPEK